MAAAVWRRQQRRFYFHILNMIMCNVGFCVHQLQFIKACMLFPMRHSNWNPLRLWMFWILAIVIFWIMHAYGGDIWKQMKYTFFNGREFISIKFYTSFRISTCTWTTNNANEKNIFYIFLFYSFHSFNFTHTLQQWTHMRTYVLFKFAVCENDDAQTKAAKGTEQLDLTSCCTYALISACSTDDVYSVNALIRNTSHNFRYFPLRFLGYYYIFGWSLHLLPVFIFCIHSFACFHSFLFFFFP